MQWEDGETDYSKPGLLPREVVPRAFLLSEYSQGHGVVQAH